jgi:membrane-associated phospholipid phosphatase
LHNDGSGGWVSVAAARQTWRTFRHDWVATPRTLRTRFALTLTIGWITSGLLVLAMSFGLRAAYSPEWEAAERSWLERLIEASPLDYGMAVFFESPGNGVVLIPLAIVLSIVFARRRRPLWALGILAATLMMAVVVGLGWMVWDRARPDFLYEGIPPSGLSAFPSGHTAMSIPAYGFLLYLGVRHSRSRVEQALAVLCLVVVVTVLVTARLVLSAHWPSDIVGGAVLGTAWLAIVIVALRRGEAGTPPRRKSMCGPDSPAHHEQHT